MENCFQTLDFYYTLFYHKNLQVNLEQRVCDNLKSIVTLTALGGGGLNSMHKRITITLGESHEHWQQVRMVREESPIVWHSNPGLLPYSLH